MKLTKIITDKDLIPNYKWIGKESLLETSIYENITEISANCFWGDIKSIERQYVIRASGKSIIADLFLFHTNGTGTLIEVKTCNKNRNNDLAAIGQLLFYGDKIEKRLGYMPRLVFAAPIINFDVHDVVKKYKLPINFLMFDIDRCVYLGS
jgi:hypothetical protein